MSEMVERVALAMAKRQNWDDAPQDVHDSWKDLARAAIEAMRKPTKEMIDKGGDILKDCVDSDRDSVDGAWDHEYVMSGSQTTIYQAMIAAALSSEDEGKRGE